MKKKVQMITPRAFADLHGIKYQTVMRWLQNEKIDGAEKVAMPDGRHYYFIPDNAKPPKLRPGRPKKDTPID